MDRGGDDVIDLFTTRWFTLTHTGNILVFGTAAVSREFSLRQAPTTSLVRNEIRTQDDEHAL